MRKIILVVVMVLTQNIYASFDVNVLGLNEQMVVGYKEQVLNEKGEYVQAVNDFNELKDLAGQGNPWACLRMGDILYFGNGVVRNEELAIKYWKQGVEAKYNELNKQWVANCNFRLGKYYLESDRGAARQYLREAAELGHSDAQMIEFVFNSKGDY